MLTWLTLLPPKARKYVYAGAAFLSFAYGIYEATKGDWKMFVASLLSTVVNALAHANVNDSQDS